MKNIRLYEWPDKQMVILHWQVNTDTQIRLMTLKTFSQCVFMRIVGLKFMCSYLRFGTTKNAQIWPQQGAEKNWEKKLWWWVVVVCRPTQICTLYNLISSVPSWPCFCPSPNVVSPVSLPSAIYSEAQPGGAVSPGFYSLNVRGLRWLTLDSTRAQGSAHHHQVFIFQSTLLVSPQLSQLSTNSNKDMRYLTI